MKKAFILFLVIAMCPLFGCTQTIENLNFISPFHDGLAAIEKGQQWAFINTKGDIVIDYRTDLVLTESLDGTYPVFNDNRCLIVEKRKGISYFGFINTSGETLIEPQYLNASNFNNGKAIALELIKENAGKNVALGKNIVYYKYLEAVIDINGNVMHYVSPKRINIVLDEEFLREPPKIMSKQISDSLYVTYNRDNTWTINAINELKN
jgi:hypothetical protein